MTKMNTEKVLRKISKILFILGMGDYWYEGNERENIPYKIYSHTVFFINDIFTILELLVGFVFKSFPVTYVNVAKTLGLTHLIILLKRYSIRYNRVITRDLNRNMVKACIAFEDETVNKEQYTRIKYNTLFYIFAVFGTVFLMIFDCVMKTITQGEPLLVVVTYWPKYEDRSSFASLIRIINTFLLSGKMSIMITMDCFVSSHLIIFQHKYRTLRKYFLKLKEDFDNNLEDSEEVKALKLRNGFREGVILHQELLRIFIDIQNAFGIPMSLQVCLCSGSAVMLLMQIALEKHITIILFAIDTLFVTALLVVLATVLWNAGEVTHEASLLPDVIFNCGWHVSRMTYPTHEDVRELVLLACAQAQRPLIMKAFGVSALSYASFVAVLKTTYSIFAVIYNKTD